MSDHSGNDVAKRQPIDPKDVPFWTSCRVVLSIMGFLGTINVYAQRINISVAMVCMVNQTALRSGIVDAHVQNNMTSLPGNDQCDVANNPSLNNTHGSSMEDGPFEWNKSMQGFILGSFFWGYLVTQIPGGWLADRYGGKKVYAIAMLIATISTLLAPIGATMSPYFLVFLRVVTGLGEGVSFPCQHSLWSNWAPPLERSKLLGFAYAGTQLGNVITLPVSALLCKYGFAGGWGSVFYVFGIFGMVWLALWMVLVAESPREHPRISAIEREYIETSIGTHEDAAQRRKELGIPWVAMLKSKAVWAIAVGNVTSTWGIYTMLTNMPTYMKEVLKFDIKSNGLFSAIPYIATWIVSVLSGVLADFFRTYGARTVTARKGSNLAGTILPAVLLIVLGYLTCNNQYAAVAVLTLALGLSGFQMAGWLVNHVDIAPPFAGILFGVCNTVGTIPGIVAPYVISVITVDQTQGQWQIVFYITAAIYTAGSIFFTIFAEGEIQEWVKPYMFSYATGLDDLTRDVANDPNEKNDQNTKLRSRV